jgi:uncharacterized protein YndB with AHSA1/START domain
MDGPEALKVATPSEREIALTRIFDASRPVIFDALTKPELLKNWLGPRGWSMVECEIDLRVGGRYRWVWRNPDGADMAVGGIFREIEPSARIVATEAFDVPWYPGEALVTNTLVDEGGKTALTLTVRYESRQARDVVLNTPMSRGVAESYDRLSELLAATRTRSRR